MTRRVFTKPKLGIPLLGLLFAMSVVLTQAEDSATQHRLMSHGYDRTHEITLNGSVQELVTRSVPGAPAGAHLLIAGAHGTTDAHLGPYLSKQTLEALHAGTPVQIVGSMETVHGKSYLLARQLIFSGRLVTVRSPNGFLMMTQTPRAPHNVEKASQVETTGGAR
jgi:hypothetical protein